VFQSMANSAPTEQITTQVKTGGMLPTLPGAPLVCETLVTGGALSGSVLVSEDPSGVGFGSVTNAGGSIFCGVSGVSGMLVVEPSGVAETTGTAGAKPDGAGSC
jgi:hypothetical protein